MSSASRSDVAIVGGGIGGLTLAVALQRSPIGCRVFEQAPQFAEEGVGLQVSPNASKLLDRLGLGAELRRIAVRPEALEMLDGTSGGRIFRAPLGDECERRFGAPLYTIRRRALHDLLRRSIGAQSIVMGTCLQSLQERTEGVELRFADRAVGTAQIAVGADGLHSTVRTLLADDAPCFSGRAVYRGVVPADGGRFPRDSAIRIWTGPGQHCVAYPVDADGTLSFTAVVRSSESGERDRSPSALFESYAGWTRHVRELFARAESLRRWELYDRPSIERSVSGRVALLGDAAHAMLPFLAQGAAAAIEDAFVLARCLAAGWPDALGAGLERYRALRTPRAAQLQAEARARARPRARPGGIGLSPAGATTSYLAGQTWIFGFDAELEAPSRSRALVA